MVQKVGFIGLGQMGRWMANNLLKAGFEVTVADIDPGRTKFLTDQGARAASRTAEVAEHVDWILLSLPHTSAVESVLFGENGLCHGWRPGLVIVDLGTTSYGPTLEFACRLGVEGIRYADAPVTGMEARARDGTLTIMFGGEKDLFEEIRPALEAIGNRVIHMGEIGSGQLTKLTNQLLFNISAAAIAEVLPMAARLGLDPEKVLQVVTTGSGRSFAAEFFGPRILEGNFGEGYPLKHAYKDMVSATEISTREAIPLPLTHAAMTTYQMALADGHGDQDKGAMIKVFERILGVEFRKRGVSS